jgi:hypothetical protein
VDEPPGDLFNTFSLEIVLLFALAKIGDAGSERWGRPIF